MVSDKVWFIIIYVDFFYNQRAEILLNNNIILKKMIYIYPSHSKASVFSPGQG